MTWFGLCGPPSPSGPPTTQGPPFRRTALRRTVHQPDRPPPDRPPPDRPPADRLSRLHFRSFSLSLRVFTWNCRELINAVIPITSIPPLNVDAGLVTQASPRTSVSASMHPHPLATPQARSFLLPEQTDVFGSALAHRAQSESPRKPELSLEPKRLRELPRLRMASRGGIRGRNAKSTCRTGTTAVDVNNNWSLWLLRRRLPRKKFCCHFKKKINDLTPSWSAVPFLRLVAQERCPSTLR